MTRGFDQELKRNAEADLEYFDINYDAGGSVPGAVGAMEALAKLAGYRIDWYAEPVKLVRL
jgi:hypothetical protein